jgi:hypothetical protein
VRIGEDVLYFCGIPVVQLRDYVEELVYSLLTSVKKTYASA